MNKNHVLHEKHEFTNVRELVEWAGGTHGDKTAYSYKLDQLHGEVIRVSYTQLCDDVRALASELYAMGCSGRHCALIGKPSYDWIRTYFAVLSIGGVLVPLDRDWTAEDLADTVRKADASFLFCDEDIADKADVIAEKVSFA